MWGYTEVMRYIRIFWIIAISLFIIPFLGIPQAFKDFLIIVIAFILGFLAWVRQNIIKHKRQALHRHTQEDSHTTTHHE